MKHGDEQLLLSVFGALRPVLLPVNSAGDVENWVKGRLMYEFDLSRFELELIEGLLIAGATQEEIRQKFLSVHKASIETDILSLYKKLGVKRREEVIAIAARFGLLARRSREPNPDIR